MEFANTIQDIVVAVNLDGYKRELDNFKEIKSVSGY